MAQISYEEVMPVTEYGWSPTQEEVISQVAKTLAVIGPHNCKISAIEFIEFDSTSPVHACGYWTVILEGPEDQLKCLVDSLD